MEIKNIVSSIFAVVGGAVSTALGGWNAGMTTLLICMLTDYVTGLIVAGVFKNSGKTENGALESRAGLKGLCRKGLILLFVLIGARIDMILGTTYVRDAICLGFTFNEILSIVENGGLMGIKYPKAITSAIEILRKKAGEEEEKIEEKEEDKGE